VGWLRIAHDHSGCWPDREIGEIAWRGAAEEERYGHRTKNWRAASSVPYIGYNAGGNVRKRSNLEITRYQHRVGRASRQGRVSSTEPVYRGILVTWTTRWAGHRRAFGTSCVLPCR